MTSRHKISCGYCFAPSPTFPIRAPSTPAKITMRKGKSQKRKPSGSGLSRQQKARFAEIASDYGVEAPKAGSQLDRKYEATKGQAAEAQQRTLYQWLLSVAGAGGVELLEKCWLAALAGLLLYIVGGGLLISAEAFFKASGNPAPDGLDALAVAVEHMFTPALLAFLVLSSLFGVFKQSQLSSGAAAYSEVGRDED